jgi:hypothetical protein
MEVKGKKFLIAWLWIVTIIYGQLKGKKTLQCASVTPNPMPFYNQLAVTVQEKFWQFMGAYQLGLTGGAAEWAVHQQKSHKNVGQHTMMLYLTER